MMCIFYINWQRNSIGNGIESWILVWMHLANEQHQLSSHNTSDRLDSQASSDIGETCIELVLVTRLFHSGTVSQSDHFSDATCIYCLKLSSNVNTIWWRILRAGVSTRFTSTSTSTSTCNMCEYEYESEYLIITWVRVRVLVDKFEYKCEYRSMINILYSLYWQQIFIVRSLTRESSDCYKPGTKLQLPIVHVNYLCQYISV